MRVLLVSSLVLQVFVRSAFNEVTHPTTAAQYPLLTLRYSGTLGDSTAVEAALALLRFRGGMLGDTTRVDGCSLVTLVGRTATERIASMLPRLVTPFRQNCGEPNWNDRSPRIILDSLSEVGGKPVIQATFVSGDATHEETYIFGRVRGDKDFYVDELRQRGFVRSQ